MKSEVTREKAPPAFTPIKLTLTLETAEEAQAFYFMFNYSKLLDVTNLRNGAERFRNALTSAARDVSFYPAFNSMQHDLEAACKRG